MVATSVHQLLEQSARARPDHPFLIDGAETSTYAQVDAAATRAARGLVARGVARGDRVGLLAPNSSFYVIAYHAILKAGAVVVPLNTAAAPDALGRALVDCEARALVASPRHAKMLPGITGAAPGVSLVVSALAELDGDGALPDVSASDLAAIIYTSGSTGAPRGAMLSHGNLVANVRSIVEYLGLGPDDRMMAILPFYYVYGASVLNTHTAVGATVVIENRFAYPNTALDTLERERCTGFSGVPSTFTILLNRSNFRERHLPDLRYVTQAGGAMSPDTTRRLIEALPGKRIVVMYGATEASARLSYLPPEHLERKLGSIGVPIPGVELRVLRDDRTEAAPGEVGEIVARGPNIMRGYWGAPEETARVLDDDGYHTGDLARRDEDGFLFIEGRMSDMLKIGAHRVAARAIEDALLAHEAIHEAAVIGVPDEILGEAPYAFVVPRDGAATLDVRALKEHLARRLPSYAVPARYEQRAELPKNESGKIMKKQLSPAEAGA